MQRVIGVAAVALAALLGVVWLGDYVSLRYQIPGHRSQFGKVTVNTLYVIHVKGGKIQYEPGDQEIDTCVHSLFPHFGDSPCWYASRHTDKLVDI
jgi:hypothetical protein